MTTNETNKSDDKKIERIPFKDHNKKKLRPFEQMVKKLLNIKK